MKELKMQKKNKISKTFEISRVLAIISVITAHTKFHIDSILIQNLIGRFSSVGVVVFIIISGYYFNPQKYGTVRNFMASKLTSIIIPWGVLGTFIYIESKLVMGQAIGVVNWLQFMVGHKSFLYYLTVLMICYLVYFYPVKTEKVWTVCIISFAITVISQQLTAWDIVDVSKIYLTNYLNVLNWCGYFCIGIMLKKLDVYKLINIFRKYILLLIFAWGILFVLGGYFDKGFGYFSRFAIPIQLLSAAIVFGISSFDFADCRFARYISKISFCTYLVHMFFVAAVEKYIGHMVGVRLFMPIITLLIILMIVYVAEMLACKLNMTKLFSCISGVRINKK